MRTEEEPSCYMVLERIIGLRETLVYFGDLVYFGLVGLVGLLVVCLDSLLAFPFTVIFISGLFGWSLGLPFFSYLY